MRFSRASLAWFLSLLIACSGGGGGTTDAGPLPDGGSGGDGATGACSSTATPVILAEPYQGYSMSLADDDVYYIDPSQGTDLNGQKSGVIRHIKADGTGDSVVYTPPQPIYAAAALGTQIFFFQLDPDGTSGNSFSHLYSVPRAGGVATAIGSFDFTNIQYVTSAIDGPTSDYHYGAFALEGDDLFVYEGSVISRVSVSTGTRTILADSGGPMMFYPRLVGSSVDYVQLDGGQMKLYTAPANATGPSGAVLGDQTCGALTTQFASAWSGGWICGRLWGLDAIDATGTTKSSFYDTKPVDAIFNPSPIDGTAFYAFGDGTGSTADPVRPLLQMDTGHPNAGTIVLCLQPGPKWNIKLSATNLVWEQGSPSSNTVSLRRLAR